MCKPGGSAAWTPRLPGYPVVTDHIHPGRMRGGGDFVVETPHLLGTPAVTVQEPSSRMYRAGGSHFLARLGFRPPVSYTSGPSSLSA